MICYKFWFLSGSIAHNSTVHIKSLLHNLTNWSRICWIHTTAEQKLSHCWQGTVVLDELPDTHLLIGSRYKLRCRVTSGRLLISTTVALSLTAVNTARTSAALWTNKLTLLLQLNKWYQISDDSNGLLVWILTLGAMYSSYMHLIQMKWWQVLWI